MGSPENVAICRWHHRKKLLNPEKKLTSCEELLLSNRNKCKVWQPCWLRLAPHVTPIANARRVFNLHGQDKNHASTIPKHLHHRLILRVLTSLNCSNPWKIKHKITFRMYSD